MLAEDKRTTETSLDHLMAPASSPRSRGSLSDFTSCSLTLGAAGLKWAEPYLDLIQLNAAHVKGMSAVRLVVSFRRISSSSLSTYFFLFIPG